MGSTLVKLAYGTEAPKGTSDEGTELDSLDHVLRSKEYFCLLSENIHITIVLIAPNKNTYLLILAYDRNTEELSVSKLDKLPFNGRRVIFRDTDIIVIDNSGKMYAHNYEPSTPRGDLPYTLGERDAYDFSLCTQKEGRDILNEGKDKVTKVIESIDGSWSFHLDGVYVRRIMCIRENKLWELLEDREDRLLVNFE